MLFTLPQLLFYLTNDQLSAYRWQDGLLSAGRSFRNDRSGLAAFADWLKDEAGTPAAIVADLIEEDFQRHLVPHVGGKAGRALIERKLLQLYRDTPYRYATVLGRDNEGRRDDNVLFCALTNAAEVQGWIDLMEQQQVPLAGMYSLTALCGEMAVKLGLRQEHLLLVTQQAGGLRQSYFQQGKLKFSRLTPAHDHDGVPANVAAETDKTRQFLTSSRLMGRGELLEAVVLCPAEQIARLEPLCQSSSELDYQFLDLEYAAADLKLSRHLAHEPQLTEQLLLVRLARRRPPGHYALGKAARFYQLWWARRALYGASGVTLVVAALWLAANLWDSSTSIAMTRELKAETAKAEARNSALLAALPPSVAKPENMAAAVRIDRMLATQAPMPGPLLAIVSGALGMAPEVQLVKLDWRVQQAAPAAAVADGGPATAAAAMPALLVGVPSAPPQVLRLEAEVMLPTDDQRGALDAMNRFAGELARQRGLRVTIEQAPLDVRPGVKLAGKAGTAGDGAVAADPQPRFILQLVWTP